MTKRRDVIIARDLTGTSATYTHTRITDKISRDKLPPDKMPPGETAAQHSCASDNDSVIQTQSLLPIYVLVLGLTVNQLKNFPLSDMG